MAAVAAAVGSAGPARLTLADVARAAGVSTGALVQRYGSKRGLLLGFVRWELSRDSSVRPMRAAFESAPDPVEGLIRAVVRSVGHEAEPAEFANNLAFLHLELADEEFRALLGEHIRGVRAELHGYLEAAVASGHLAGTADLGALAAAADSIRNGTQLAWAMDRSGPLAEALRRDLRTLLDPYRVIKEEQ
ncbi:MULTISPECIES: TetR family transcriptional regulator [Streptosporangium]|uniref:AcrR family transcriptional regulator n=1 Tax=Streptosporangium brasiliense TaxID=47480 RepID=A0ABT9QZB3_9ACTN|nr:TetR family transcriptional regulator [Streptosporangium brasiliense]MDP9862318.1 AcrR family transcriptional regulator [Streptosporangium brasiliense]